MQSNPKVGDKVLLASNTLAELRANFRNFPISWEREVEVRRVTPFIFQAHCSYELITDDGHTLETLRHEFLFPIVSSKSVTPKTCNCDLRLLMNRGCQCGTKV